MSRWKDSNDDPDEPIDDNNGRDQVYAQRYLDKITEPYPDLDGALASAQPDSQPCNSNTTADSEYNREGMKKVWIKVVYAAQESDFEAAWLEIITRFGTHQKRIIQYIEAECFP